MPTITSATTMTELLNEYKTTCSYAEQESVALAKRFVTACRALLALRPTVMRHGAAAQEFDAAIVERQLREANQWVNLYSAARRPSQLRTDLSCLRT